MVMKMEKGINYDILNKYMHNDIKRFCLENGYTALCRDEPELVSCGCTMQAVTEDTVRDIPENEIFTFPYPISRDALNDLAKDYHTYFSEYTCVYVHVEESERNGH